MRKQTAKGRTTEQKSGESYKAMEAAMKKFVEEAKARKITSGQLAEELGVGARTVRSWFQVPKYFAMHAKDLAAAFSLIAKRIEAEGEAEAPKSEKQEPEQKQKPKAKPAKRARAAGKPAAQEEEKAEAEAEVEVQVLLPELQADPEPAAKPEPEAAQEPEKEPVQAMAEGDVAKDAARYRAARQNAICVLKNLARGMHARCSDLTDTAFDALVFGLISDDEYSKVECIQAAAERYNDEAQKLTDWLAELSGEGSAALC